MKPGISLGALANQIGRFGHFFMAHNRMIYFVLFLTIIIGAIGGLNLALYKPTDDEYRTKKLSEAQSARFDTATIEKIQQLNSRQQTSTDALPGGRINPFGE